MQRKNFSFQMGELNALEPLIKRHNGNFSAAMRDVIEFSKFAIDKMGSLERAKELMNDNMVQDLRIGDQIVLKVDKVIRK